MRILFCLAVLIFLVAAPSAQANKVILEQARSEYVGSCKASGGLESICACGFSKIETELKSQELLDLARSVSSGLPSNEMHLKMLAKATTLCAKEEKRKMAMAAYSQNLASQNNSQTRPNAAKISAPQLPLPTAQGLPSLPSLTPPPTLPKMQVEEQTKEIAIDLDEEALDEDISEKPKPKKSVAPHKIKEIPYQGEYDGLFFNTVLKEDIVGMNAIADVMPNVDVKDSEGNTALMLAAKYGKISATKFLLSRDANTNLTNIAGQNALHIATYYRQQQIVSLLLESGANIDAVYGSPSGGFSALVLAILNNDNQIAQTLLANKANPNLNLPDGNLPIHVAAVTDNPTNIQLLRQFGADINAKNADGFTALMVAAAKGKLSAAQTLLQLGADPNIVDPYGRTAYIIAQNVGNFQFPAY